LTSGQADDLVECLISQDWGYTVFSTVGAFYIPLLFMLLIYASIYRVARARIRKKQFLRTLRIKSERAAVDAAGQESNGLRATLEDESHAGANINVTVTELADDVEHTPEIAATR